MLLDDVLAEQLDPAAAEVLGGVLRGFARDVGEVLGADLVEVLLAGSFALRAGDAHSDVDVVVVLVGDPTDEQERALAAMHRRRGAGRGWAGHLEVSYAGRASLASPPSGTTSTWLHVDNGAVDLVRSGHDDTLATRWVLHAGGVPVVGPDGPALVPPVDADALRREAVRAAAARAQALADAGPGVHDDAWLQPYLVATFCRLLVTARTGTVVGKAAAMEAAAQVLPTDQHDLLAGAARDRADPWGRVGAPGRPDLVARMPDFVTLMARLVREAGPERPTPFAPAR